MLTQIPSGEQLQKCLNLFPTSKLPELFKQTKALLTDREERAKEASEKSLSAFIRHGWKYIDPSDYVHGWHIDAISEHLEAVNIGQIRRLIINIPPRHMKSISGAVAWPAFTWARKDNSPLSGAHTRFLFCSYAQSLSVRDSLKTRRLIESPWYQKNWGDRFEITSDQNTKIRFDNSKGGYRIASSVDSSVTGEGGDIVFVDDPHNVQGAESDVQRDAALNWWDGTMSTRLNDPKTGAYIVMMQRIHELDLTGHILAKAHGWDHLCLPMRYDSQHIFPVKSSIGYKDPRSEQGSLIWPERIGEKEAHELEKSLGARAPGQLQQTPFHDDGTIYKRSKWRKWTPKKPPPIEYVLQVLDTAFEEGEENDPSACTTWGIFHIQDKDGNPIPQMILLDAWEERLGYPALRDKAIAGYDKYEPDVILIEKKASGQSLLQDLRMEGLPVLAFAPGGHSKTFRAQVASVVLESDCIWLPTTQNEAGEFEFRDYAAKLVEQAAKFPRGAHDDLCDCLTMASLFLRRRFWLGLPVDDDTDYISEGRKAVKFYG